MELKEEMSALQQQLLELEERLMQPQFRRRTEEVALLLADDFCEFGSSGRVYNKARVLELLRHNCDASRREVDEFQIRVLAPDVVLVTYRVARHSPGEAGVLYSLRSSIWQRRDGRWQMTFHQGTPTGEV